MKKSSPLVTKIDEQKKKEYITYLNSRKRISGLTHTFYRYPASFSPQFIRDNILGFTREGDVYDTD